MSHLFYDVDCLFMVLYSCFYQTKLTVILLAYFGVLCTIGSVCMWVYIYVYIHIEREREVSRECFRGAQSVQLCS